MSAHRPFTRQTKTRPRAGRSPFGMAPCWNTYYELGRQLSGQLRPERSLEAVGAAIGVTKQNAYTEVCVALGKLAYALRKELAR